MNTFQEQLMAIKTEMNNKETFQEIKVEVKDIDASKQIKQVKIEVNTNDKNLHNNIDKGVVINKINTKPSNKILVKRGQVFWADLGNNNQGSEQSGRRPVIIIQNDVGNTYSPTTIIAVITSQLTKAKLPVHVELQKEINNMPQDSVILFEQIRTLDKRRLQDKICQLDELMMRKIDKAIGTSLGIKIAEVEQDKKPKVEENPLERLPQNIQNIINDKLDDIKGLERTISNITRQSLIKHLMEERESKLLLLERICIKYNLNYKDYYVMYKREGIKSVM